MFDYDKPPSLLNTSVRIRLDEPHKIKVFLFHPPPPKHFPTLPTNTPQCPSLLISHNQADLFLAHMKLQQDGCTSPVQQMSALLNNRMMWHVHRASSHHHTITALHRPVSEVFTARTRGLHITSNPLSLPQAESNQRHLGINLSSGASWVSWKRL